ncbi:MAG: tyrosine-type recombinase/integrase, partial [Brevinema sp.]
MGLLKRNGTYYLEYKIDKSYKRMSLKTKNKDLAQKMYEAYLLSQITNKFNNPLTITPQEQLKEPVSENRCCLHRSFNEYKDLCMTQNLSKSIMQSKERLNKLFKDKGIKYLDQIDQKFVSDIVSEYKKDSANRHMKNLKAFLNFCIKKRYYERVDFEVLTFVRQEENIRDLVIDDKDYLKLIENCKDDDFRLYMMTLWETGCRPSEIVNLKKSDIDFNNGTAKIYQNKTNKYKIVYFTDLLLKEFEKIETERMFLGYDK